MTHRCVRPWQSILHEKSLAEQMFSDFQQKLKEQFRAEFEAKEAEADALKAHILVLQTALDEMREDVGCKEDKPNPSKSVSAATIMTEKSDQAIVHPVATGQQYPEEVSASAALTTQNECSKNEVKGQHVTNQAVQVIQEERKSDGKKKPGSFVDQDRRSLKTLSPGTPKMPRAHDLLAGSDSLGLQHAPKERGRDLPFRRSWELEKDSKKTGGKETKQSDSMVEVQGTSWQVLSVRPSDFVADLSTGELKRRINLRAAHVSMQEEMTT